MAVVLFFFALLMMGIIWVFYLFFKQIIREHFHSIAIRNLGIYGKLIFVVDAFFMVFVFCTVALWFYHTIWK